MTRGRAPGWARADRRGTRRACGGIYSRTHAHNTHQRARAHTHTRTLALTPTHIRVRVLTHMRTRTHRSQSTGDIIPPPLHTNTHRVVGGGTAHAGIIDEIGLREQRGADLQAAGVVGLGGVNDEVQVAAHLRRRAPACQALAFEARASNSARPGRARKRWRGAGQAPHTHKTAPRGGAAAARRRTLVGAGRARARAARSPPGRA